MTIYSVDIRSFTASFRYPMLISGTQLTLEVPPVSTVMGLINAASGRYICHFNSCVGYYFEYQAKGVDIETIYMAEVNKKGKLLPTTRSNAIRREFLFEPFLRLYSTDETLIECFRSPIYPLLLGRGGDLATADIKSIQGRPFELRPSARFLSGQVLPYAKAPIAGKIQPLAQYFSDTIPRSMLGKEPYVIIDSNKSLAAPVPVIRDNLQGRDIDIYMHQIDSLTLS